MNSHIEKAKEIRNEIPMMSNCSQTILKVYAKELGLTMEQAQRIASNFGGGMKHGSVCGVVTAAMMVLGAKGVTDPGVLKQFRDSIAANHEGMINCSDLLRANIQRGGEKKSHCDGMIYESIALIDEFSSR